MVKQRNSVGSSRRDDGSCGVTHRRLLKRSTLVLISGCIFLNFYIGRFILAFPTTADRFLNEAGVSSVSSLVRPAGDRLEKAIPPGGHFHMPPPNATLGPNGEEGWVHDPTVLRKNPLPLSLPRYKRRAICLPPGEGDESQNGAVLLRHMRRHIEERNAAGENRTQPRVLCAIYTYSGRTNYTEAVRRTWGRRCDGLILASDTTNTTTGHSHIASPSRVGYKYKSMYQRVRSILAYIYDHYLNERYDYFHICGDDVYMIVENLKEFLASDRVRRFEDVPDQYVFAGFWMHWNYNKYPEGRFYLGGGSGYTLSRKALKAYVEGPLQTCKPEKEHFSEDIMLSDCLFDNNLTKNFVDTRDEYGAHRYHQLALRIHANDKMVGRHKYNSGYTKTVKQSLEHMERAFGFPMVERSTYVSNSSIAFHRHKPHELYRYELLLYRDGAAECGETFRNASVPTAKLRRP